MKLVPGAQTRDYGFQALSSSETLVTAGRSRDGHVQPVIAQLTQHQPPSAVPLLRKVDALLPRQQQRAHCSTKPCDIPIVDLNGNESEPTNLCLVDKHVGTHDLGS